MNYKFTIEEINFIRENMKWAIYKFENYTYLPDYEENLKFREKRISEYQATAFSIIAKMEYHGDFHLREKLAKAEERLQKRLEKYNKEHENKSI